MIYYFFIVVSLRVSVLNNSAAEAYNRLSYMDRRLLIQLDKDLYTKPPECLRNIPLSRFNIFPKSI